jgi:hypothetical protein
MTFTGCGIGNSTVGFELANCPGRCLIKPDFFYRNLVVRHILFHYRTEWRMTVL